MMAVRSRRCMFLVSLADYNPPWSWLRLYEGFDVVTAADGVQIVELNAVRECLHQLELVRLTDSSTPSGDNPIVTLGTSTKWGIRFRVMSLRTGPKLEQLNS